MHQANGNSFSAQDILASIVVFLVALPLCMGVAIASGAPVAAGLLTGIIGGLIVGTLAGCPLQVSGPAAGLTVIVYEMIEKYGFEMLGAIVLLAGLFQVIAAWLRLGQWFRAVSPAVIKGMLAGIGVLIFASQFHVMVDDKPKGSGLANLASLPDAIVKGISWPKWESLETRRIESELLRSAGELHRRQAALRELVAERVSHQGGKNSESHSKSRPGILQRLLNEQADIMKCFEEFQGLLTKTESDAGDLEKLARVTTDIDQARQTLTVALDDLTAWRTDSVLASQDHAVRAFDLLLADQKNHNLAAGLGLITILLIVIWQAIPWKRLKLIPGPLVAVSVTTVVAAAFATPVLFVEVPDQLWEEIRYPSMMLLAEADWRSVLQSAAIVACIASAETLLCATAVDQMQAGTRTKYDRELFSQGVGNTICGLVGALPLTGVIVRSSANVQAGAKSRWSAVMHGIWLLLFVVGFASLLRLIPTASLAAVLVYTGYKLIDFKAIKKLSSVGWGELAIFMATLVTIVLTDLLTGVVTGVVLAAAKLLLKFAKLQTNLVVSPDGKFAKMTLQGAATFVRLPNLASALESLPPATELHVDFQQLTYIDHACLELLMNWAKQHESLGGRLVIDWETLHSMFSEDNAPQLNSG